MCYCTTWLLWNCFCTYFANQNLLQLSGFSIWKLNPNFKERSLKFWSNVTLNNCMSLKKQPSCISYCNWSTVYEMKYLNKFVNSSVATSPVVLRWLCDSPRTVCMWRTTPYIYVAQTSNNRVIMACELYCWLLPQCEALRMCRSGFPITTVPSQQFKTVMQIFCIFK